MTEKKATHTPGPWSVEDGSILAAEVCVAVIEDRGGYQAPPEQRRANANLIVAAPDLLAALENIVPRFHKCCVAMGSDVEFVDEAVKDARAAIAKAKGEA